MEESIKPENILKQVPKVENMKSSRNNIIANQFIIKGDNWELFQSYKSPIALMKDGILKGFTIWLM